MCQKRCRVSFPFRSHAFRGPRWVIDALQCSDYAGDIVVPGTVVRQNGTTKERATP